MKSHLGPSVLLAAIVAIATAANAQATEVGNARTFGLGLALGAPSSITAKYFLGPTSAIDGGLSFTTWGNHWNHGWCYDSRGRRLDCDYYSGRRTHLSLYGDYLWQDTLARGTAKLDWHVGVGGRLWFYDNYNAGNDLALAARVPLGLDLTFQRPNFLELFFELAPALYVLPGIDLDVEGAIGVRFYF